jgi:transcriptional regulator with XRE-family HTH domain
MDNSEFLKDVGCKLKSARLANKMSLQKLGKLCNIHYSSIWFMEQGKTNVHILSLKAIADVFNMDVKEFL